MTSGCCSADSDRPVEDVYVDPVCGMTVAAVQGKPKLEHEGKRYHFVISLAQPNLLTIRLGSWPNKWCPRFLKKSPYPFLLAQPEKTAVSFPCKSWHTTRIALPAIPRIKPRHRIHAAIMIITDHHPFSLALEVVSLPASTLPDIRVLCTRKCIPTFRLIVLSVAWRSRRLCQVQMMAILK